jgi:Peptidase S24-like
MLINDLKLSAKDLITNSRSELEMCQNIEKIRMAMIDECDTEDALRQIQTSLNRLINNKASIVSENYEIQLNDIQLRIFKVLKHIDRDEIEISFEYNCIEGLRYLILASDGSLKYKFVGSLQRHKPHGKGIAYDLNDNRFDGSFQAGLREGMGKLVDKYGKLLQEGKWEKDTFVDATFVCYYRDFKVAASVLCGLGTFTEPVGEWIQMPKSSIAGLIAFPIEGDSMQPTFLENDIIVCKKLNQLSDVIQNKPHVILHNGNLMLKMIQIIDSVKHGIQKVRLISENYLKYNSIDIEINKHTEFFKVVYAVKNFN